MLGVGVAGPALSSHAPEVGFPTCHGWQGGVGAYLSYPCYPVAYKGGGKSSPLTLTPKGPPHLCVYLQGQFQCASQERYLLFHVMQLMRGRARSPTSVAKGPSLSPVIGGKGQGERSHCFSSSMSPHGIWRAEVSPCALMAPTLA